MARRLFAVMARKQSNLAVAADVELAAEVVQIADKVGPYICCLKTHCDLHTDWSDDIAQQ